MSVYKALQPCYTQHSDYRSVGIDRLVLMVEMASPMRRRGRKYPEALNAHISMHGARAKIDFNPSYGQSQNGVHPCSFEGVEEVTREVFEAVSRLVPLKGDLAGASVTRLDIARDFDNVNHRYALMEGLRRIPRPRRLSAFSNRHLVWTPNGLTILGQERVGLYDRNRLHPEVPAGVLRFEARLGSRWLNKAGIEVFSDISAERCLEFLRDRWDWSLFGSLVIAEEGLLEAVARTSWGESAKAHFYWSEMKRRHGFEVQENAHTRALRRRQREEVGQSAPLRDAYSVRLDFDRGTEDVTRRDPVAGNTTPGATRARLDRGLVHVH